jgi:hypothetical protein
MSAVENGAEWVRWYDRRPTDQKALYRWRVSERVILGLPLRPEWSGKLFSCGMGYGENELWPRGSDWDGYSRTIDKSLEWRLADADLEPESSIHWGGLDLLPCPHFGNIPAVECARRWAGAMPHQIESLTLNSAFGKSYWNNAARMRDVWNTRA